MARRLRYLAASSALSLVLVAVACGGDEGSASTAAGPTTTTAEATVSGSITVFAAASLTESFNGERATLKSEAPDLDITFSFAGSGALVTQVQGGAPADVIATADTSSMQKLVDAGLVEAPTIFARNKLEILVAPGNPLRIKSLPDLARDDIKLVLGDENVPAGKYAAQALTGAGVTVHPVSKEPDVKSAVAKVTSGEADATVVYVSDVKATGSKGDGVEIPDAQNIVAEYPIAVVKATRNAAGAQAFVDAIVRGGGQQALEAHGFLAAS